MDFYLENLDDQGVDAIMKAPYFITGPVGAGKTSMMVYLMTGYLNEGRPVATNIDVFPEKMKLNAIGKKTPIVRLPDEPRAIDLINLGRAYPIDDRGIGYDEKKNGMLALDETAFFMNSREWNKPDRMLLIKWLRLVRKRGWNPFLGVQDIDSIDNQILNSLCRSVGWCHSSDVLMSGSGGNFIGAIILFPLKVLVRMFIRLVLRVPRVHMCSFYLGKSVHSGLKQETTMAWGNWLYESYNTAQEFTDGSDMLDLPIVNAKGDVQIKVSLPDGVQMRYVSRSAVDLIPGAEVQRETVFRDMRAPYTILPASYIERWYPVASERPQVELVPGFWPSLLARVFVWLAIALLAVLHRRKWRDEALLYGVIKPA